VPLLLLHDVRSHSGDDENRRHLLQRLRLILAWAVPLVARGELHIVEFRRVGVESAVPELMPQGCSRFEDLVEVVLVESGLSAAVDVSAPRALVCGGVFELALYPCHDLLRGGVLEVGLVPQLWGSSGRSGELLRSRTSSHLERVLGVRVLGSLRAATQWLLPGGPKLEPTAVETAELEIIVEPQDGAELSEEQRLVLGLLLPQDVSRVRLHRIGKGWTSALKFFCVPTVVEQHADVTGATTFIKMGLEEKLEYELDVTQYMMEVLGGFCPQVLGYAEHGATAAIHLSLADLSVREPRSLADLYEQLTSPSGAPWGSPRRKRLLARILAAVDFVFDKLLLRLHSARSHDIPSFSIADELGLCKDLPSSRTGSERGLNMNSAWVLRKVWSKDPGDGGLASSVRLHASSVLGEEVSTSESWRFLDGHPLELPGVCSALLESPERIARLRDASCCRHRLCFVHGDLHGDNIMVDAKDNRFLIDFGKTGLGHSLEDATWLESFMLLSYTDLASDAELGEALDLVPALAPSTGLTPASCEAAAMEAAVAAVPSSPRIVAMWSVVKRLRLHLGRGMRDLAAVSPGSHAEEVRQAGLGAALLLLRNALFFVAARENHQHPRRRRLALALACAYAQCALAALQTPS